jgi:hypothetical protein
LVPQKSPHVAPGYELHRLRWMASFSFHCLCARQETLGSRA